MDRSEGDDDELYPDAPMPAHERGWRHPSEIGQAAWANSEPPLTIGRGLSAATGAVGAALALAVLWAVVPTHAGHSVGVSAVATTGVTTAATTAATTVIVTIRPSVTTSVELVTTNPPATTIPTVDTLPSTSTLVTTTVDVEHPSSATYQIEQAAPRVPNAVAVAINDGTLVLTTANAVARGDNVALMNDNGDAEPAHVVMVDNLDGLAVLAAEEPTSTPALRIADTLVKGDVLTFYDDQHPAVTVGNDGSVTPDWSLERMRDGTPVLNQRGELVALCTKGDDGMHLVVLSRLGALRAALAAEATTRTVRIGITLGQQPDSLRIMAVDMTSPAADAGVRAGDTILAIDAREVASRSQFAAAIRVHHPGDVIAVELRAADGSTRTVDLVLAAPRPNA